MPNFTRSVAGLTTSALGLMLDHMGSGNRSWLARNVIGDRRSRRSAALADFADKLRLAFANAQYDIAVNGECWLLEQLSSFKPALVIDCGANRGDWSRAACEIHQNTDVHAFEIVPATFAILRERTAEFGTRMHANCCGLSDKQGTLTMFHADGDDVHSSYLEDAQRLAHNANYAALSCAVRTGDDYLSEHGLLHVDLLKIDVEGAEQQVLQGFGAALDRRAIDVIQFEYGKHCLFTKFILRDFHEMLERYNFVLGKLYPDGVEFKDYDISAEDFIGPNYVACQKSRLDLIDALKRR